VVIQDLGLGDLVAESGSADEPALRVVLHRLAADRADRLRAGGLPVVHDGPPLDA
jgi:hypothetical protein